MSSQVRHAVLSGACAVVLFGWSARGRADVRLPALISDHLVLLSESEVVIWGWADPGEEITVVPSWMAEARKTNTSADGRWRIPLRTGAPGGPHTLTISGKNTITVRDVLVGEVWLGSGQSNMEWPVSAALNPREEIAAASHPNLRLFTVERAEATSPADEVKGAWQVCTPESVGGFSAVAYYFGRTLMTELKAPVGMITSSWGGTEIEKWIPEPAMLSSPEFAGAIESRRAAVAEYEKALAAWKVENENADAGTIGRWENPALDEADWAVLPAYVTWGTADLANFDGVAWFRATFDAPDGWAGEGATLELGAIDDQDRTYVNGVLVGSTADWTAQRVYALPSGLLKPGRNYIAIRVHDTGGAGGFSAGPGQPCVRRGEERAAIGGWKYRIGVAQSALKPAPQSPAPRNSVLYNGMISPLTSYAVRGVLWYQGESNVPRAAQYGRAFPLMIRSWREAFEREAMPFYYVQIAPFAGYGSWGMPVGAAAELRDMQRLTLSTPGTGMVVTTDLVPDVNDIHPPNKQEVGKRLARWALAKTYQRDGIEPSGPVYKSMSIEGRWIRLTFDHVGKGLTARGGELSGFTIAGEDRVFVPAEARIDGSTVLVRSVHVSKPAAVRFAWEDAPIPSFFNLDGLPASPFRTDNWPLATAGARW